MNEWIYHPFPMVGPLRKVERLQKRSQAWQREPSSNTAALRGRKLRQRTAGPVQEADPGPPAPWGA